MEQEQTSKKKQIKDEFRRINIMKWLENHMPPGMVELSAQNDVSFNLDFF